MSGLPAQKGLDNFVRAFADEQIWVSFVFTLKSAQYTATQVTGILAFTNILNEPFPYRIFNPQDWPGVFA